MAHYSYVVRKRGGSYVEALSSVDKRSDAGDTFDSRKKLKKKLLASLLGERGEGRQVREGFECARQTATRKGREEKPTFFS